MANYADLIKQPVMGGSFGLPDFNTASPSDIFGGKMTIPKDPGMSFPDWDTATPGSVFGGQLPTGISNPIGTANSNWASDLSSLLSSFGSNSASSPAPTSSGGGFSSWLNNFLSGNPANGGASGLAPYLAAGAGGIAMAKDAQNQATKEADKLSALGQPYTDAGKQLLSQYQGGTLRPDQQKVVDTSAQFSSDLLNAASPLSQIAQQAFADYNSGKLGATDELKLNNQVAAQKQQIRQRLQSSGITDSSVLAAQDQQIDNQAMIARQDLLDKRFATGNTAYDQWLKTTNEGQQLKLQGQQFAATSFEQMLNNALGLANEGMQPAMEAIRLKIQSDAELSQTVSELLGNLASAYSYAAAGPKTVVANGGGGGGGTASSGGGGGGQSGLSQIISGISGVTGLIGQIGDIFGFEGAGGQAAGIKGALGDIAGIATGIDQGGLGGYGSAINSGIGLADKFGFSTPLTKGVGELTGSIGGAVNAIEGVKNKDPIAALQGASTVAGALATSSLTSGTALGSAAASSGLGALGGPLAVGMALEQIGNHIAGNDVKQPLVDAWAKSMGLKPVTIGPNGKWLKQGGRESLYALPNGKWITFSQAYQLADRMKNQDQAGYDKLLASFGDYWNDSSHSKWQPVGGWDKYVKEHPGSTKPQGKGG